MGYEDVDQCGRRLVNTTLNPGVLRNFNPWGRFCLLPVRTPRDHPWRIWVLDC